MEKTWQPTLFNIREESFKGTPCPRSSSACVGPFSTAMREKGGYKMGGNRGGGFTHTMFVDDLKLYSSASCELERMIAEVVDIAQDIGMEVGRSKCVRIIIDKGEVQKERTDRLDVSDGIRTLEAGDWY